MTETSPQPPEFVVIHVASPDHAFSPYKEDDRECDLCSEPIGWLAWGGQTSEPGNRWHPFYDVHDSLGNNLRFCLKCWDWLGRLPCEVTPAAVLFRAYDGEQTRPCPAELFVADDHHDCTLCEGRGEVAFRGMRWPVMMNCPICAGDPHPGMPHLRQEVTW